MRFFYGAMLGPHPKPGSIMKPGSSISDIAISKRSINSAPPEPEDLQA